MSLGTTINYYSLTLITRNRTNLQRLGAVPAPDLWLSTTACGHKIWLYHKRVVFDELYELNMKTLAWTHLQFNSPNQHYGYFPRVNALTERQIALCNKNDSDSDSTLDTWILDLPSLTWKQYTSAKICPQIIHTIVPGPHNNTVIIFDKRNSSEVYENVEYPDVLHLILEPKALQHIAMQTVFEH